MKYILIALSVLCAFALTGNEREHCKAQRNVSYDKCMYGSVK